MISWSSSTASSDPATSVNVVLGVSFVISFAFDFPKFITREPPPCIWFIRKRKTTTMRTKGSSESSTLTNGFCFDGETVYPSLISPVWYLACRFLATSTPWSPM